MLVETPYWKPLLAAGILFLCVLSAIAAQWGWLHAALLCGVLANGFVVVYARHHTGSYSNLLVLFIAFSFLYGYSGPVAEMYGGGLHATFKAIPAIPHFFTAQALALSGFALGLLPARRILPEEYLKGARAVVVPQALVARRGKLMGNWAIGLAALASLMEVINLVRIGGLGMIAEGKAVYQSLEADLFLTMPSYIVANLAFALLALSVGLGRREAQASRASNFRRTIPWFFLSLIPLLLTTIMLGRRGPLIAWLLIAVVGITLFRPITKLRRSLVLGVIVSYVLIAFVFSSRGAFSYALSTGDWEAFKAVATDTEDLVDRISPGGTEFGAAFGNYSAYVADPYHGLLLGESYVEGLVVPVPSILYPGPKPKQITYEFRDRYFAQTALQGAIAGTGFSSLLEAYMNFGYLGILLVYALVAALLSQVERLRYRASRKLAIFPLIVYLMLLQQMQFFHRSAFGHVFGTILLVIVMIWMFKLSLRLFRWSKPFMGYAPVGNAENDFAVVG